MSVAPAKPHVLAVRDFARRVREHLFSHILPFWCGPAVDLEHGGWMGWLANDLTPDRTQPKGLIVHSRILWAFAAVHQLQPDPLYRQMADRAFAYVMNQFWDPQYGGAFWRLDDRGNVRDDSKKIYGQAFCIFALTEFHRAFPSAPALARAQELFELIERHAHDAKFGGYIEVCRRDWSAADPEARLSEKDLNEKKSMNNHLHVLEAYTNLHRVAPSAEVALRLRELIQLFLQRILDSRTGHLHHFFDEAWQVRSDSYTFGHDIEASWLLGEAAEELGDATLRAETRQVALRMASVVRAEGLAADGGLYYEGKAGQVIDRGRECWPQAEAVVGFLSAFQLGGEVEYLESAHRVWDYIEQNLVDRVHGEWFWRLNPDGQPDPKLPKVSEWKGPYHATRACLETLRRLEQIPSRV
ncbi:MAG: AGE family epimerase/isomerase [Verrucomicrobia subdivision 3 bacterium]|nr:AGE family epimerase/isomerase [Limisphaerales bacterium]